MFGLNEFFEKLMQRNYIFITIAIYIGGNFFLLLGEVRSMFIVTFLLLCSSCQYPPGGGIFPVHDAFRVSYRFLRNLFAFRIMEQVAFLVL